MNIKELRASTGMTQSEFGKYFNIPMRTIQNWEGGKRNCPKYLAELIEYKLEKEEIEMKKIRTFEDFLQIIHGMGYAEYLELNEEQKMIYYLMENWLILIFTHQKKMEMTML